MIYGDLDQSYKYIGLLNPLKSSIFKVEIAKGQDHHFSKNDVNFKELSEIYNA